MPNIPITFTHTRESDAWMQAELERAVERQKVKWAIKVTEAQTIPLEVYSTPDTPVNANEAKAMEILLVKGPSSASQVANLMQMPENVALASLRGLVGTDKATEMIQGDRIVYTLKQNLVKKDHPYKGKMLRPWSTPVVTKRIDQNGKEEWTITCDGSIE